MATGVLTRALPRSLEPGKIVILLQGRFAGHKAVVVKCHEAGTKERKYPHIVVAGVDVSLCGSLGTADDSPSLAPSATP